jgi:hypothetical protein
MDSLARLATLPVDVIVVNSEIEYKVYQLQLNFGKVVIFAIFCGMAETSVYRVR